MVAGGAKRHGRVVMIRIILIAAAIGALYFAWLSRPGRHAHAELYDVCKFSTITTSQYRDLISEAKQLIFGKVGTIRKDTIQHTGGAYSNAALADFAMLFLKRSASTEETFVRFHAFGRAIEGRALDSAPSQGIVGASAIFDNMGPQGSIPNPDLVLNGAFQLDPGLFRRSWYDWILGRLMGRRFDVVHLSARYAYPGTSSLEASMTGSQLAVTFVSIYPLAYLLNSTKSTDVPKLRQR